MRLYQQMFLETSTRENGSSFTLLGWTGRCHSDPKVVRPQSILHHQLCDSSYLCASPPYLHESLLYSQCAQTSRSFRETLFPKDPAYSQFPKRCLCVVLQNTASLWIGLLWNLANKITFPAWPLTRYVTLGLSFLWNEGKYISNLAEL